MLLNCLMIEGINSIFYYMFIDCFYIDIFIKVNKWYLNLVIYIFYNYYIKKINI